MTPNGVDPAFVPGDGPRDYVLAVGAIQPRKNQLAALAAAREAGLPLVVAGPGEGRGARRRSSRRRGARVTGYVEQPELVRLVQGAACLVQASRHEGFGLPVLEAMAAARRSSPSTSRRSSRWPATRPVIVRRGGARRGHPAGDRRARAPRRRRPRARAQLHLGGRRRRTLAVYREALDA